LNTTNQRQPSARQKGIILEIGKVPYAQVRAVLIVKCFMKFLRRPIMNVYYNALTKGGRLKKQSVLTLLILSIYILRV